MSEDDQPSRPPVVRGEVLRAVTFRPMNDDTVHRVTSARKALSEDQKARTKRYLISMTIRTVCFLGAVAAHMLNAPAWLTWSLVAGAVALPYIAVVMVNAGRENDPFTVAGAEPIWDARGLPIDDPLPSPKITRQSRRSDD
jgi:hypothetical protein